MNNVINNDFFAPANTNLLDHIVAEYRTKRKMIEEFYSEYEKGEIKKHCLIFARSVPTNILALNYRAQYAR